MHPGRLGPAEKAHGLLSGFWQVLSVEGEVRASRLRQYPHVETDFVRWFIYSDIVACMAVEGPVEQLQAAQDHKENG